MSKRIISLLLVACMSFCLASCNRQQPVNNDNSTQSAPVMSAEQPNEEQTPSVPVISTESVVQPQSQAQPVDTTNPTEHSHSYSAATCTSPKKCSCGATAGNALGHQFSSATCTSPQICSRCGVTSGNALGHNYSAANCNSPKTCTRCGQTQGSSLGHNYVNNKCSRCGKTDPDSLPVGLDKLVVIDCKSDYISQYKYDTGSTTDSFGNEYIGYHYFPAWPNMYAIYFLDNKYSNLSFDIAASDTMPSGAEATIAVYVDGELKFSKTKFTRTTGKVSVSVDVENGQQLEIRVTQTASRGDPCARVLIVNAQLTK